MTNSHLSIRPYIVGHVMDYIILRPQDVARIIISFAVHTQQTTTFVGELAEGGEVCRCVCEAGNATCQLSFFLEGEKKFHIRSLGTPTTVVVADFFISIA